MPCVASPRCLATGRTVLYKTTGGTRRDGTSRQAFSVCCPSGLYLAKHAYKKHWSQRVTVRRDCAILVATFQNAPGLFPSIAQHPRKYPVETSRSAVIDRRWILLDPTDRSRYVKPVNSPLRVRCYTARGKNNTGIIDGEQSAAISGHDTFSGHDRPQKCLSLSHSLSLFLAH